MARTSLSEDDIRKSFATNHVLSVADLEKLHPDISRATLYRVIGELRATGEILEVSSSSNAKHFELAKKAKKHHHVSCVGCNKIKSFQLDSVLSKKLYALQQQLGIQSNIAITSMVLEFYGRCKQCVRTAASLS